MSAAVQPAANWRVDFRTVQALVRELPLSKPERELARFVLKGLWDKQVRHGAFSAGYLSGVLRDRVKVSEKTVRRGLRELERWGLIQRDGWMHHKRTYQLGYCLEEAVTVPTADGVRLLLRHHGTPGRNPGGRPPEYATEGERRQAHADSCRRWRERREIETSVHLPEAPAGPSETETSDQSRNTESPRRSSAEGPSEMETSVHRNHYRITTSSSPDDTVGVGEQRQGASSEVDRVNGPEPVDPPRAMLDGGAGMGPPSHPGAETDVMQCEETVMDEELVEEEPPAEWLDAEEAYLEPEGDVFVGLANAGDLERLISEWRSEQDEELAS